MASRTRSAARWMGLALGALVALSPIVAYASAMDLYYERALMSAANERCRLFKPVDRGRLLGRRIHRSNKDNRRKR